MDSLFINKEVLISIKNNNLRIQNKEKTKEIIIPLHELKTILIDDFFSISKKFFEICIKNNITLIMTDEKHYPSIFLLNLNNPYFKMYDTLKNQLNLENNESLKMQIWKKFLFIKILNSFRLINVVSKKDFCKIDYFRKIYKTNNKLVLLQIEGEIANLYYKMIFGESFKRQTKYYINKDVINSFLNYGYTILRSKIIHYLSINGLMPYFSIFHSSNNNNFALADDILECYRYLIDYLVIKNIKLFEYLDKLDTNLKKLALSVFSLKVKVKNKGSFNLNDAIMMAIKDYKNFLITKELKFLNKFKTQLY